MPVEPARSDDLRPMAERRQMGRALRRSVPRGQHAAWRPPNDRRDPLDVLMEANRHRISSQVPLRHARMQASPFAFLQGSVSVMAADLATTPTSGIWVQSCGDCHLANFGTQAALDGAPVFDITDYDETLPAPFEWDLKRLVTSIVVDARWRSLPDRMCRDLARQAVCAYRRTMYRLMPLDPQRAWQWRVVPDRPLQTIADGKLRQRELKRFTRAVEAHRKGHRHLLERRPGGNWALRQRASCPVLDAAAQDDTLVFVARTAFDAYKLSQPEDRGFLLDRYRLTDVAFERNGIASIGTFRALGLFVDGDGATLLLQLREAQQSALVPHAARSAYLNQGQRVVTGQRIMQSEPDIFLGWTNEHGSDQYCYVRQVRGADIPSASRRIADRALPCYAVLCGMALGRAHARSGDAARLAGYMGASEMFDEAIAQFAIAYAAQVESDWRLFCEAIRAGAIEASDA